MYLNMAADELCGRSRVQEMLAMAECMECIVTDHQTSPSAPEAPEETPKKKKKKRDKQHAVLTEGDVRQEPDEDGEVSRAVKQEREQEEELTAPRGGDQHLDGATDSPPTSEKKKKKKKKKDEGPKDEGQEQAVTVPEQHGSDSSGYLSDKPSRKRRLEMAVEIIPCPREDPQRPKSKKKRKSDA